MKMPRPTLLRLAVATLAAVMAARSAHAQTQQADTVRRDSLPAILIGRVVDNAGGVLTGAEITVVGSEKIHAVTNDSGQFRINGLPAGTNVFAVRRIGYEAATFTAVLKPGKASRANFSLAQSATALPAVAVTDTANNAHWLETFERRRTNAKGTFIARDEIVHENARTGTDIIRHIGGIRLQARKYGGGNYVLMMRGSGAGKPCVPQMFVHNMPYSGDLDDFLADDIEAVEVYMGVSEIPPELDKGGKGLCGAIVVWTRDPKKTSGS